MAPVIDAWFVLVVSTASWMNREQDKALQYLMAENRVLKDQLKNRGGRIRFTDKQRRLLAAKAKALGRAALNKIDSIVTPDTLLRWHRQRVAKKYDGSGKRFVLSIRSECLDRLILFSERQLRRACTGFLAHYHLAIAFF